jgi:hypothetical protein
MLNLLFLESLYSYPFAKAKPAKQKPAIIFDIILSSYRFEEMSSPPVLIYRPSG